MKNKKARAFIATLAVTTVVTAQPVSVLHAEESNAGNKESVGSEESKKALLVLGRLVGIKMIRRME